MGEALNFTLKLPTLKELTEIRIARSLWCSQNWSEFDDGASIELSIPLRNNVKSLIPLLPLPKILRKDLEIYVNFISEQIHTYFKFLGDFLIKNVDFFTKDKLRWTAYGKIDVCHLAKLLIRDDRVPVAGRYVIACECCFQEDIERLWNEMKPKEFHQKKLKYIKNQRPILVYYWSCLMKGKLQRFHDFPSVNPHLSTSAYLYNKIKTSPHIFDSSDIPLKYLWNKMTESEKRREIERATFSYSQRSISRTKRNRIGKIQPERVKTPWFKPFLVI